MTDTTQPATEVGGDLGGTKITFNREPLSQQDIFAKSATMGAEIVWTLVAAVEADGDTPAEAAHYVGIAPWGRFILSRHAEAGTLLAYFENKAEIEHAGRDGSFNALISLSDCDSVAVAKASVMRKLLDGMNQSRRDDPLLDEAPPEEDLI